MGTWRDEMLLNKDFARYRRCQVIFLNIWAFFTCACFVTATEYYINPTGHDNHLGTTQDEAWQSINKVNDMDFKPGDRILFEGGRCFTGQLFFNSNDAGLPDNPVVVSSFGVERATIRVTSGSALTVQDCGGFEVSNLFVEGPGLTDPAGENGISFYNDLNGNVKLEHIRIDHVEVSGFHQKGISIGAWNRSGSGYKDIRITRAVVHDNGDQGISVWGVWPSDPDNRSHQDLYIGYCRVFDNPGIPRKQGHTGNGIIVSGVNNGVIEYSEAYNNGTLNSGNEGGPIGIWAWESTGVVIQHCESHHNKTNNNKDGGGFDLDGGCVNCIMQYNYSHDNHGAGYGLYQFFGAGPFRNNVVRYNISENDGLIGGYGGITFWATYSSGGIQNTKVYNNTLYISANTTGAAVNMIVDQDTSFIHHTEIYNNIFITVRDKKVIDLPITGDELIFKGNCYWTYGDSIHIRWEDTIYRNLTDWQYATGQETLDGEKVGMQMDPRLNNPGRGGTIGNTVQLIKMHAYQLKPDSPCIDAGLNLYRLFGINVGDQDFYGIKIPQSFEFDIGAHEADKRSGCDAFNSSKNCLHTP
jgi:hypothetical protein